MIVILLLFFFILAWLNYYKTKDLISPTMLMLFGWLLSVALSLFKYKEWGDITPFTTFVIVLGTLSFILGASFAKPLAVKNTKREIKEYSISLLFLWFSVVFISITVVLDFLFIYRLAYSSGFSGGTNFLTFARYSLVGEEKTPYYVYIPIVISQAIVFCLTHCMIHNFTIKNKTKHKFLIGVCIALYLILCFLSTGRTMIMYYAIFVICDVGVGFYKYRARRRTINRKILRIGIFGILSIFAIFLVIQVFFRSSKYGIEWNMFDEVVKYSSSSIYAFDNYLKAPYYANGTDYETLYNLQSVLNRIGFSFEIKDISLQFTEFSGIMTNVYTALRRYIHDYGFAGMIIIQMVVGFVYTRVYIIIRNTENMVLEVMYFSSVYALPFISIEERFLVNILSIRTLLTLVFVYLIFLFAIKQRARTNTIERMMTNERDNTCGRFGHEIVSADYGDV